MPPKHIPNPSKSRNQNNGEKALADCVLPDDITLCILMRLPVKSLLRFKAVCKPWSKLFATPKFIRAHHRHFSDDSKNEGYICIPDQYYAVMSLSKEPTDIESIFLRMKFVGCCSGLICLGLPPLGQVIVLWNPAMRLYKFLPLSKMEFGFPFMFSLGFGYDQERDDFKVVRIVYVKEGEKIRVGVEVYSSLWDSWETMKLEFEFHVFHTRNSLILDGNPIWHVKMAESGNVAVVWFDVRRMVFKKMRDDDFEMDEEELKNRAIVSSLEIEGKTRIPLMDQNGSVFVLVDGGPNTTNICSVDFKVQCLKDGRMVEFWFDGIRFVFDPERRWVKEIKIIEPRLVDGDGYSESLACIRGMKPLGN